MAATPDALPDPAPSAQWPALMAAAQAGDREAYGRLLAALVPGLRARCRAVLRDATEAEDAVQDVLLTIHRMRHAYDPSRPFRPWLAAITQARIADRQRVSVRRVRRETALDATHETVAAPAANHDATEDGGRLHLAIATLPAAERQAVRLLKLEELSLKEASSRTGLSATALKVACHRAIRRLRLLLDSAA
jgi:RNA polymerase sigma-70 factor (ECF subfamily)